MFAAARRWGYGSTKLAHVKFGTVLGEDGRRLAKRHGDTRLATYRDRGVSAERTLGLLAAWSGVVDTPSPMTAREFLDRFDLERLPSKPVIFTPDQDRWLRG